MFIIAIALALLRRLLGDRAELAAENLALRHQLAMLLRNAEMPQSASGRSALLGHTVALLWRSWLVIIQPATVVAWHRQGFRLFLALALSISPHRAPHDQR